MTLLIVDGNSLANRVYYALSKEGGGVTSKDGIPTTICSGFLSMLAKLLSNYKYSALAIAFDPSGKTFRHEIYPEYKAGRNPKPDNFHADFDNLKELLALAKIACYCVPSYEADDVIATIASQCLLNIDIYSSDKDLHQLLSSSSISVVDLVGNRTDRNNAPINPLWVVSYKALCGDKSDNIPGGKGIGDKTAIALLQQYGNLDNLYHRLNEGDRPRGYTKVLDDWENIYMSHRLARLVKDIPINFHLEDCNLSKICLETVSDFTAKLNLTSEVKKLNNAIISQLG